jgi:hypothetical protein
VSNDGPDPAPLDPHLVRRAKIARMASLGQRTGYALFAVAVVAFFVGFFAGFTPTVVTLIVATMAVGSVALAPAIVFSYGVKAAEREDREQGR